MSAPKPILTVAEMLEQARNKHEDAAVAYILSGNATENGKIGIGLLAVLQAEGSELRATLWELEASRLAREQARYPGPDLVRDLVATEIKCAELAATSAERERCANRSARWGLENSYKELNAGYISNQIAAAIREEPT